jgi:hypothetical protein
MTEVTAKQLSIYTGKNNSPARNVIVEPIINFTGMKIDSELYRAANALHCTLRYHAIKVSGLRDVKILDVTGKEILLADFRPVMEFDEVEGEAIFRMFDYFQLLKVRQLRKIATEQEAKFTFDVVFIEPDPTHTVVVRAWKIANAYIRELGGPDGKRDLTAAPDYKRVQIRLDGDFYRDENTMKQAKEILNDVRLVSSNPHSRTRFVENISKDVVVSGKSDGKDAAN